MAKLLPFRAVTGSGNQFDFEYELHPETVSAVHVSNLLNALLGALDQELKLLGNVGNGDLLQALAMALATRTRMLPGDPQVIGTLARDLLQAALDSKCTPAEFNVAPDAPKDVH